MKILQRLFLSKSFKERVLIIAMVLSFIIVMFPPFEVRLENTAGKLDMASKRSFLLSGPPDTCSAPYIFCNIAFQYLGLELAGVWFFAGIVYILKKD